jgi:PEP-CTERM motif-containing protein
MKIRTAICVALAASLSVAATEASAALVSENSSYGTNTLTLDTSTGLEWLDLTLTQNMSINQVSGQLGAGQQFAGFQYAHATDLHTLILDGGASAEPLFFSMAASNITAVTNLISLFGQTFTENSSGQGTFGSQGWTAEHGKLGPDDAETAQFWIQQNIGGCPCASALASGFAQSSSLDFADPRFGSFLIRPFTATVPEPSTWAMMILGFAGIGFMAYRRKSKPASLAA